jgi:hypothetical protein
MFVTQKEIEARLASDENLLNAVLYNNLSGRPSGDCSTVTDSVMDRDDESESLQESDLNTASVDPSVNTNGDTDIKLRRILDEVEFDQELRDWTDERSEAGRPKGAADRTTDQRADIALMGSVLGHGLAADLLGISTASSSLHARGQVNHGDDVDLDLDKVVKRKLHKIRNKSADALIKVLDNADTAQMYDAIKTAKDAVFVANSLAGIIQKVQPQEQEHKPTAQFVIIQPTVRSIEQYEVINV